MNKHTPGDKRVSFDALVRELLKLDPSALAAMDTDHRSAAAGLHVFMRRTLERALGTLWAPDTTIFGFRTETSARALDWPNAALCNLSTLFVWALCRDPRRIRGKTDLPLRPVDLQIADLPLRYAARPEVSTKGLVAMARELLRTDSKDGLRSPVTSEQHNMSVSALVEDMLGFTPEIFVRSVHGTPSQADKVIARDLDAQVADGLAAWLMSVLDTYESVIAQKIQMVGLMIVDEGGYDGQTYARQANLTALLTGALLHEERDVAFYVLDAQMVDAAGEARLKS